MMNSSLENLVGLIKNIAPAILIFIIIIVVWELLIPILGIPPYLIPRPSEIVSHLLYPRFDWGIHLWVTFYETIVGFVLGIIAGISLALLITSSMLFNRVAYPYIVILQIVPKVAIAPIIFIWLGYGIMPKIAIAFLISFFPIIVNTATGLISASPEMLDVVRSLKASAWQTFSKVRFPSALPFIFAGLKVAVTLAVIGAIVAEFIGGNQGLGYIINVAGTYAETDLAFAGVAILSLMGISLYILVIILEKIFVPWARATRAEGGVTI